MGAAGAPARRLALLQTLPKFKFCLRQPGDGD